MISVLMKVGFWKNMSGLDSQKRSLHSLLTRTHGIGQIYIIKTKLYFPLERGVAQLAMSYLDFYSNRKSTY